MSEGDQQQHRKQTGYLIIMWLGFIGPVLWDEFVLKPFVIPAVLQIRFLPSLTTLIMLPSVIWYVVYVYWK